MDNKEPAIKISGLHNRYKGSNVDTLKGIDLTIDCGEFYGILGPNAAGKTTLISIISGLLKYKSGQVLILGNGQNQVFKRSVIGLVPQEIALYPNLTVRENVGYFGQMHGIFSKVLEKQINHLLEKLQLTNHADKRISRCSGGIKRRTNIAAGMIHKPRILVLDEPTVGVDAQSRNLIFEYLKNLNRSGTTILYTTHYMSEAEELCSEVSIIDEGLIVKTGQPDNLVKNNDGCKNLGDVFLKLTGKALRE